MSGLQVQISRRNERSDTLIRIKDEECEVQTAVTDEELLTCSNTVEYIQSMLDVLCFQWYTTYGRSIVARIIDGDNVDVYYHDNVIEGEIVEDGEAIEGGEANASRGCIEGR